MVRVLASQRQLGGVSYPLTVRQLVELTDPAAPASLVQKVVKKRSFQNVVVIVRPKEWQTTPLALLDDLPLLASDRRTLEFLLRCARTPANHALSVADLKSKATGKLQKAFQDAVTRQMAEGALPPTVGWICRKNTKLLFLLQDLNGGGLSTTDDTTATEPRSAGNGQAPPTETVLDQPPAEFAPAFSAAFERLDRQHGSHNFVSLVDLRQVLPFPREAFDAELRKLRQAGQYTLKAAEGRHGISPREQADGILEDGVLLLYVARKSP
jgi:hypothetical protein